MRYSTMLKVVIVGILLITMLWIAPTRIYCLRPYPPPTWDNPPIHPNARDVAVMIVDRPEVEPTLLRQNDGPTILHKVVTYKIASDTNALGQFLFWSLANDCWQFGWSNSPGAEGISTVNHRYEWRSILQSKPIYFYDMLTRTISSDDLEVVIHTRRSADE